MDRTVIKNTHLAEEYYKIKHKSGLTMLLYPKKEYNSAYALFGTNYGSIDTKFKTDQEDDYITVPDGVAHFLEHKLFENEKEDAFARYAKTGASANAFTSFDKTAYLFSCTDNFEESLEILLDFVTHPYFTPQTVEKEQGIIGQEIRMYEDDPEWRVYFNLLKGLYINHTVKLDIAGTKESIAQITDKILYRCYNTFYNLNNMALAVCGNFDVDTVIKIADSVLKPADDITIDTVFEQEPLDVAMPYIEEKLEVALPLFHLGFKEQPDDPALYFKGQILNEILLDIIAGESSGLYRRLYDLGLINSTFSTDVIGGNGYSATVFSGESKDPQAVKREIIKEINKIKSTGIDKKTFETAKKKIFGRYIRMFNKVDTIAMMMLTTHFYNSDIFSLVDTVATAGSDDINERLKTQLNEERCTLSVVISNQSQN